ncbi:---NA--- [Paramuricea clavata]|uniref:---NA n=1 Tax=Paramuricea clavata TaxID=317549 RepID=A0A7D9DDJ4_PARCT|nr:---NA--- [Paramuricea clavata]
MDLILAINRNTPVKRTLHKKNAIDGEMAKRMNITKFSNGTMVITNTTEVLNVTDMILQENIEEKVADHLLEGDILLDPMDPEDYKIFKLIKEDKKRLAENRLQKRQATRALKHLWTSRVVPYEIDWSLSDYKTSKLIKDTIALFNTKSCVKFMPRQRTERDWVVFIKNDGTLALKYAITAISTKTTVITKTTSQTETTTAVRTIATATTAKDTTTEATTITTETATTTITTAATETTTITISTETTITTTATATTAKDTTTEATTITTETATTTITTAATETTTITISTETTITTTTTTEAATITTQ